LSTSLVGAKPKGSIDITISNASGGNVMIAWMGEKGKDNADLGELLVNTGTGLSTFANHQFQIREIPLDTTGACQSEDKTCRVAYLKVKDIHNAEYSVNPDFEIEERNLLKADADVDSVDPEEAISICKELAKKGFGEGNNSQQSIMMNYKACLTKGLAPKLKETNDEIEFMSSIRHTVASNLENFTCADPDMDSSPDVRYYDWISDKDHVARAVHIKLDRPASRIRVVENFASEEECQAVEEEAADRLSQASTADGKGGHQISKARKALQASIHPAWDREEDGDLIAQLSRRVYDFVNHVLDLDISHEGQEPLMSIQYNGRGKSDGEPDRYTPHCDGECEGKPYKFGQRMATMVIYCTIPERGGHTNFRNSNVHIKPSAGSAIFFGYIDPETKIMDDGFTTHSGCPVYEGEKKIVTQWVRLGVTKEVNSDSFNTLGILHSEAGED